MIGCDGRTDADAEGGRQGGREEWRKQRSMSRWTEGNKLHAERGTAGLYRNNRLSP